MNSREQQRLAEMILLPEDSWPDLSELTGDLRLTAELIGVGNALLLAQFFEGTPVRLYGVKAWMRRRRDQHIRRDYDAGGYTVIDLARKYHLSDRQVSNILGRPDGRQLNLFGGKQ